MDCPVNLRTQLSAHIFLSKTWIILLCTRVDTHMLLFIPKFKACLTVGNGLCLSHVCVAINLLLESVPPNYCVCVASYFDSLSLLLELSCNETSVWVVWGSNSGNLGFGLRACAFSEVGTYSKRTIYHKSNTVKNWTYARRTAYPPEARRTRLAFKWG